MAKTKVYGPNSEDTDRCVSCQVPEYAWLFPNHNWRDWSIEPFQDLLKHRHYWFMPDPCANCQLDCWQIMAMRGREPNIGPWSWRAQMGVAPAGCLCQRIVHSLQLKWIRAQLQGLPKSIVWSSLIGLSPGVPRPQQREAATCSWDT